MKLHLVPALLGLALSGCVSTDMWSEAPRDGYGYGSGHGSSAPVGWWGSNAVSVDVFYGALAGYGRWDRHPGYGRVFIPAGVGPGWQPYSRGYWVNDPRWGRRWVSNEPFGWATYHYGRWGRDSRLGWFWVPDTRFGPSWVDWRRYGGYDSWAPLPPIGWSRYAGSGFGWGNDWWLHAPSAYAWQPAMVHHVRRGKPEGVATRPDRAVPLAGFENPDRADLGEGRHPRSQSWQRSEAVAPGDRPMGRHPRGTGWAGSAGAGGAGDGRAMQGTDGRAEVVRAPAPVADGGAAPQGGAGMAPVRAAPRALPQPRPVAHSREPGIATSPE